MLPKLDLNGWYKCLAGSSLLPKFSYKFQNQNYHNQQQQSDGMVG